MVDGVETLVNHVFNLGIALHLRTGESLVTDFDRLHGFHFPECAHPLVPHHCDLHVRTISQPIRVDHG